MRFCLSVLVILISVLPAHGQTSGSNAETLKRIEKSKAKALERAKEKQDGYLNIYHLKEGEYGIPANMSVKVVQVLDKNAMLVILYEALARKERKVVKLKLSTAGITVGKMWGQTEWKQVTGHEMWVVAEAWTYQTKDGGAKTVSVLQPMSKAEIAKNEKTETESNGISEYSGMDS